MDKKLVHRKGSLDSDWQVWMSQILIYCIKHVSQVILILFIEAVGHWAKLSVDPASSCPHEGILTLQLAVDILLQEGIQARLKLCWFLNVVFEVTKRM